MNLIKAHNKQKIYSSIVKPSLVISGPSFIFFQIESEYKTTAKQRTVVTGYATLKEYPNTSIINYHYRPVFKLHGKRLNLGNYS
jgi:hypothetical protein